MSTAALLQAIRRRAQVRALAIVLARTLPWLLVSAALGWRLGGIAWLPAGLLLMLLAVFARRAAQRLDGAWLARALDAARPEFEDSAALLSVTPDSLPTLPRLQQARLQQRLASMPAPDLRASWPGRTLAFNTLGGLVLAGVLAGAPASWFERSAMRVDAASPAARSAGPTQLVESGLTVTPPAYTGRKARTQAVLAARVEAGATVGWRLRIVPQPASVSLRFHDGSELALQADGAHWTASRRIDRPTLYRILVTGVAPPAEARLHRIETIADRPPQLRVLAPERSLSLLDRGQAAWPLLFEASDDYGLGAAQLRVTLAQGSGENIAVSARTLTLTGTGDARQRRYARRLDLRALGFAPGDDLIVRLSVSDRRAPVAQLTRSASFILRWPAETGAQASGVEGLVKRTLPAYFRSQRQIIIDSEALLAQRGKLPAERFLTDSDGIGVDQRILRLRYGQFLGEEAVSGGDAPRAATQENEHDDEHGSDAELQAATASSVLEAFGHTHDAAEAATLLDPGTRKLLKSALDAMWQSELHLRQGEPGRALPYQYIALRHIKQVQQASRIYLARVGLELPPVDEGRRLGGDRDGLQPRGNTLAPARRAPSPALALWQALDPAADGAEPTAQADAFARWLSSNEGTLPDALDHFAALDAWRRAPACVECAQALRSRLWTLLPTPPATVAPRIAPDARGRVYLDALAPEATP